MRRFYLPPDEWVDGRPCALVGDEAHHCRKVARVVEGDEVEVIDGAGRSARARVRGYGSGCVDLEVLGAPQTHPRGQPVVHLAFAVPKGKNIELVIQKATELGVDRITPLITERTIVRPGKTDQSGAKLRKWQRISMESIKQCGRKWLPEITLPVPWREFLATGEEKSTIRFLASLEEHSLPVCDHLELLGSRQVADAKEVVLVVGPEGDFSPGEYTAARDAGFHASELGEHVLRAETAAIAGLAILISEVRRIRSRH